MEEALPEMADGIPFQDYGEINQYLIDRILEPARRTFRLLGIALLLLLIALPFLQIVLRQIFHSPFIGAEELARFTMICVTFITFPYVVSAGGNIRLEEFQAVLPAGVIRWLRVVIAFCGTLAFAVIATSTYVATFHNLNNATPTLGIPYYIFFGATFVGTGMAAVECAVQAVKAICKVPLYVKFDAEQIPEELKEL